MNRNHLPIILLLAIIAITLIMAQLIPPLPSEPATKGGNIDIEWEGKPSRMLNGEDLQPAMTMTELGL